MLPINILHPTISTDAADFYFCSFNGKTIFHNYKENNTLLGEKLAELISFGDLYSFKIWDTTSALLNALSIIENIFMSVKRIFIIN